MWAWAFKCYELLKAEDDTNDSRSWAYESKWYEQLRVVDDMNNFNSLT